MSGERVALVAGVPVEGATRDEVLALAEFLAALCTNMPQGWLGELATVHREGGNAAVHAVGEAAGLNVFPPATRADIDPIGGLQLVEVCQGMIDAVPVDAGRLLACLALVPGGARMLGREFGEHLGRTLRSSYGDVLTERVVQKGKAVGSC